MIIGYDAKRAFQNRTGLGNYSRTLLDSLHEYFPQHRYVLFAPKQTAMYNAARNHPVEVITPENWLAKQLPSIWRSKWITHDLKKAGIGLYHGLSNEMPAGIEKTGIRSVVTIHDLIFEHYPMHYDKTEVWIYRKKSKHACDMADAIIATGEHTKKDIVELYDIHPDKVHIGYQSCDPIYSQQLGPDELLAVKRKYNLPEKYLLYVGSIVERKNLLIICKALYAMKGKLDIPLVVMGEGKAYKKQVQQWLARHGLTDRVIFLSDTDTAKNSALYRTGSHFPAIYQNATAFIYPSMYEGFGIPVLEALHSKVPVITTYASSLPEVGGDAALYFESGNLDALCQLLWTVVHDETVRKECLRKAEQHILQFTPQKCAASVMEVYRQLLPGVT